jgi:L-fucose mutarotase/ribose pyranase (RbsD/FucU family)
MMRVFRSCFSAFTSLQIHTLERRPYANVLLTKGVVGPDGRDLKP